MPDVGNAILANAKASESGGLYGILAGAAVGYLSTTVKAKPFPAPWYKQPRNLEIGGVVLTVIVLIVLIKGKKNGS